MFGAIIQREAPLQKEAPQDRHFIIFQNPLIEGYIILGETSSQISAQNTYIWSSISTKNPKKTKGDI